MQGRRLGESGSTCLFIAAAKNHVNVIVKLLSIGANMDLGDGVRSFIFAPFYIGLHYNNISLIVLVSFFLVKSLV